MLIKTEWYMDNQDRPKSNLDASNTMNKNNVNTAKKKKSAFTTLKIAVWLILIIIAIVTCLFYAYPEKFAVLRKYISSSNNITITDDSEVSADLETATPEQDKIDIEKYTKVVDSNNKLNAQLNEKVADLDELTANIKYQYEDLQQQFKQLVKVNNDLKSLQTKIRNKYKTLNMIINNKLNKNHDLEVIAITQLTNALLSNQDFKVQYKVFKKVNSNNQEILKIAKPLESIQYRQVMTKEELQYKYNNTILKVIMKEFYGSNKSIKNYIFYILSHFMNVYKTSDDNSGRIMNAFQLTNITQKALENNNFKKMQEILEPYARNNKVLAQWLLQFQYRSQIIMISNNLNSNIVQLLHEGS